MHAFNVPNSCPPLFMFLFHLLVQQPSPPPKMTTSRSLGINSKRSFASFTRPAMASTTTLHSRSGRGSDTMSLADASTYTLNERYATNERIPPVPELRKPKGMAGMGSFLNVIKKKASRIGKDDSGMASATALVPPPVPSPDPAYWPKTPPTPPKKVRRRNHQYPKSPGPSSSHSKEPEFTLDTNLDEMEGIVDLTVRHDIRSPNGDGSSPGSGFETSNVTSSSLSVSDGGFTSLGNPSSLYQQIQSSQTMFSNPFLPQSSTSLKRKQGPPPLDIRKVSPKTVIASSASQHESEQHSPGWVAPESWAVEKEGELQEVPDYTTSDEEDPHGVRTQSKPVRRKTRTTKRAQQSLPSYQIRIHRSDGSYHVVKLNVTTTVSELIPVMNRKLVLDSTRETHSLYVKERERGNYKLIKSLALLLTIH